MQATPEKTSINILKMNVEFACESRDTVKSFGLTVFVKTISKLNMEHGVKSEEESELEN